MTEPRPVTSTTTGTPITGSSGKAPSGPGTALPLWVAAISLAVIAVVSIIASFQLLDALHATQTSVVQLQQQVAQLKSGLGVLLGG